MKFTLSAISVVVLFVPLSMAQMSRPVPPGMRHAQELEAENEKGFPPVGQSRSVDTAALRREADQLASMAASLPSSVDNVSRGMLDKDLIPKLKQIEKLSKHLRSQLDH